MTPRSKTLLRVGASALLAAHLLAVIAAPLAAPPTSGLFGTLFFFCRPYLAATNLNQGYRFFGPDPGPGSLVRYEVELADGTRIDGIMPDRHKDWPRLLYHRHFMLCDRLPPVSAGSDDEAAIWKDAYARSYAQHLYWLYHARSVKLYFRNHLIPFPEQVEQGIPLDDARFYEERLLIDYRGDAT